MRIDSFHTEKSESYRSRCFLGGTLALALLIFLILLKLCKGTDRSPLAWALLVWASFLEALDLAHRISLRVARWVLPPRSLPRLDYGEINVAEAVIAVPVVLQSVDHLTAILSSYLQHSSLETHVVLLASHSDSPYGTLSESEIQLLTSCSLLVAQSNTALPTSSPYRFWLLYQAREFSKSENAWIGPKRKAGKLEELGNLLRGVECTLGKLVIPDVLPTTIQWVLVLDEDSLLAAGCLHKLLSVAQHPSNSDVAKADKGEKVYSLFQANVVNHPESYYQWRPQGSFVRERYRGMDAPPTAVDAVFTIFGRAPFFGKGLFHVSCYSHSKDPPRSAYTYLSHDTVDCIIHRCAMVPDATIIERFPSTYSSLIARFHRWARGDAQNGFWLFDQVRAGSLSGEACTFGVYHVGRNLLQTLTPIALGTLVLTGVAGGVSMSLVSACYFLIELPDYMSLGYAIVHTSRSGSFRTKCLLAARSVLVLQINIFVCLAQVPIYSYLGVDALIRSSIRVWMGKNILDWTTMASLARTTSVPSLVARGQMFMSLISLLFCLHCLWEHHYTCAVLCGFWATSPVIQLWFSSEL